MGTNYRIVVGVDGSEGGRRALRWAVHEAHTRGGTVQAVIAWQWDVIEMAPTAADAEGARQQAVDVLDREIAALPDYERGRVAIASEAVEGQPAEVLTGAARDAELLVLGSHGHSRVWHTVLGSVSEACIRQSSCPVVVIPLPQVAPSAIAEPAVRPSVA
jgi:nucleotide-binding universal stress UspA family protein